jgi:hypothetical protein
MKSTWASGDFDTWIDNRRTHCRAYGVEFARSDIERMIPRNSHDTSSTATVGGIYEPAKRCLAEITGAIGGDQEQAIDLILKNCRAGLVPSRCRQLWYRTTDRYRSEEEEQENVAVPEWAWEHCLTNDSAILNWDADRFAGEGVVDGELRKVRVWGLSFEVSSIVALETMGRKAGPSSSSGGEAAGIQARPGGRKLSELWPDWVAEFVINIHDNGWPAGAGAEGQEELIKRVADALAVRGLEGPSRATVQRTVQATLDRWRAAGK